MQLLWVEDGIEVEHVKLRDDPRRTFEGGVENPGRVVLGAIGDHQHRRRTPIEGVDQPLREIRLPPRSGYLGACDGRQGA